MDPLARRACRYFPSPQTLYLQNTRFPCTSQGIFCITARLVRASQCLAGASPRAALDRAAHGYGLPVKGSARIPRADRSLRFSVSASAVPGRPATAPNGQ